MISKSKLEKIRYRLANDGLVSKSDIYYLLKWIRKYQALHGRVAKSFNDDICVAWTECETHSGEDRRRMDRAFRKFLVALDIEYTPGKEWHIAEKNVTPVEETQEALAP